MQTAREEPHLLTAILVIASKDLVDEPYLYEACAAHMKMLVSDLASGGHGGIEAVEALLLLSEWVPYTQRAAQVGKVGRGEEDYESWIQIGLALRIAYFLGLDRFSFRVVDENADPQFSRKRLVWTGKQLLRSIDIAWQLRRNFTCFGISASLSKLPCGDNCHCMQSSSISRGQRHALSIAIQTLK